MTKPISGLTQWGSATTGSTADLDANFTTIKTAINDLNTYPNYLTDTGSANAYVVTLAANLTGALTDGLIVQFKAVAANTGSSTLNYNATGTKTILLPTGDALPPGAIQTSGMVQLEYRSSDTVWILQNATQPNLGYAPRNLIVNPNWQIDQINEGALYTVNTTDVRGPDGWSGSAVGAGVFKLRTLADPDNAALKCMEITCTTADASIAATDDYFLYTAVEGYDAAALQSGVASAQPITIQFKFKTSVTGVYGISVANSAINRRYIGIITVADTSEHEYVTTLTLDTAGTWLYTSGVGLYMRICLAAGSNFQSTSGAWAAGAEQTTAAQCNFMSVNTNIAYLKRVRLVQGSSALPYDPADLQKELAKAQRYYAKTFSQGTAPAQSAGRAGALCSNSISGLRGPGEAWQFPSEMRAAPTVVTYSPQSADANWRDTSNANSETVSVGTPGTRNVPIEASTAANSGFYEIHATASARIS